MERRRSFAPSSSPEPVGEEGDSNGVFSGVEFEGVITVFSVPVVDEGDGDVVVLPAGRERGTFYVDLTRPIEPLSVEFQVAEFLGLLDDQVLGSLVADIGFEGRNLAGGPGYLSARRRTWIPF